MGLLKITKVVEQSSFFIGKIISLLPLVLILAKSPLLIKSQDVWKEKGKQPKVISEYSRDKGGVNSLESLLRSYRPNLHSKEWWWSLFFNALNITVVTVFKMCKNVCTDQLSHLDFHVEVAEVMVRADHEAESRESLIRWSNCSSPRSSKIR